MGKYDNLSGHCAIVTGAAGGIGQCFTKELTKRGCSVIMTDISDERLRKSAADILASRQDADLYLFAADITFDGFIDSLETFISAHSLNPDILINNAGIFAFSTVTDLSESRIECFINLHVRAVTLLSRWMATRRMAKGSGWILNMSSMSCWSPMPGLSMYAATKAYIRVFTRSLHYEMRDCGVKVMAACPGGIATDLFGLPENLKRLAVGIGALDTPVRFARKAVTRLMKGRMQYINGWLNRASIFLVGITPTPIRMMVKHKMLDKGIRR